MFGTKKTETKVSEDTIQIEFWIAWNEDGDAIADFDSDNDCAERFDDEIGGYVRRMTKVTLTVPAATIPEVEAVVAADAAPRVEVKS